MKKVIGTALCLVFLFSCSENNDVATSNQSLEIESTLSNYNDAFFNSSAPRPKLSVIRLKQIIFSDVKSSAAHQEGQNALITFNSAKLSIVGAGAGNTNGGVDVPPPMNDGFHVNYEVPAEFATASDIGEEHNDILSNVFFGDVAAEDYILDNYGDEALEYYNSDAYQSRIDIMISITNDYMEEERELSYLLTSYREHGLISEDVGVVLSLFSDAFSEASTDNEITAILEYYSQTVYESEELTESDKVALFSAFSVARSSSNYWNNFEN